MDSSGHYHFVEIGTCDFGAETLTCPDTHRGLAVEPMEEYLARLPDRPLVRKRCAAVSDHDGSLDIYYVSQEDVRNNGLPYWLRGCNRTGSPHPRAVELLGAGSELIRRRSVPVLSVVSLLESEGVSSIDYLKIDTEGHDCVILGAFLDYCATRPSLLPKRIRYESNSLTPLPVRRELAERLRAAGYLVSVSRRDTEAVLLPS